MHQFAMAAEHLNVRAQLNNSPDIPAWSKLIKLAAACAEIGDFEQAVVRTTAALWKTFRPTRGNWFEACLRRSKRVNLFM